MQYSVWNPATQRYTYFQTGEGFTDDTPRPTVRSTTDLGCSLSDISWRLPPGAQRTGEGTTAIGVVVHPPVRPSSGTSGRLQALVSGLGGYEYGGDSVLSFILLGLAGVITWRHLEKRR